MLLSGLGQPRATTHLPLYDLMKPSGDSGCLCLTFSSYADHARDYARKRNRSDLKYASGLVAVRRVPLVSEPWAPSTCSGVSHCRVLRSRLLSPFLHVAEVVSQYETVGPAVLPVEVPRRAAQVHLGSRRSRQGEWSTSVGAQARPATRRPRSRSGRSSCPSAPSLP